MNTGSYLGWDINLEVKVAIKEFFPLGAVTRNVTVSDAVTALAGNTETLFSQGRERFIERTAAEISKQLFGEDILLY